MRKFTEYFDTGFEEAQVNFCGIPGNPLPKQKEGHLEHPGTI
jgi:hypothetical protein